MGRLLVLVLLAVVVVWLIRRALRAPTNSTEVPKKTEDLVRCAHCGVHLPRAEAHAAAGALYCSDQHAQLGPGKR